MRFYRMLTRRSRKRRAPARLSDAAPVARQSRRQRPTGGRSEGITLNAPSVALGAGPLPPAPADETATGVSTANRAVAGGSSSAPVDTSSSVVCELQQQMHSMQQQMESIRDVMLAVTTNVASSATEPPPTAAP